MKRTKRDEVKSIESVEKQEAAEDERINIKNNNLQSSQEIKVAVVKSEEEYSPLIESICLDSKS